MNQKTKLIIVVAVIIIGMAIFGYFKSTPNLSGQTDSLPQIEITPVSFDFGAVRYGQVLEYDFKLKNSGTDVLKIKRVATSCACTTASARKELVEPGEETNIHVSYDTGAMSGPHGKGEQQRIIFIKSNDPVSPQIEVTIKANVE